MPNKRGDGETNIQKYGYFNLKKIKNIAPNGLCMCRANH